MGQKKKIVQNTTAQERQETELLREGVCRRWKSLDGIMQKAKNKKLKKIPEDPDD